MQFDSNNFGLAEGFASQISEWSQVSNDFVPNAAPNVSGRNMIQHSSRWQMGSPQNFDAFSWRAVLLLGASR